MEIRVRCEACGAEMLVPDEEADERYACVDCEHVFTVPGRATRSRAKRSKKPATRPPVDAETKAWARRRIRAAKLCSTSIYACVAAVPCFFLLGLFGVLICGTIALGAGLWGMIQLRALGPGPRNAQAMPGVVRLASTMGRTAPQKAGTGIAIGVLLIGASLVLLFGPPR